MQARVAKYSYGTESTIPYDAEDLEHTSRRHFVYTNLAGREIIRNHFSVILPRVSKPDCLRLIALNFFFLALPQNTVVYETQEFRTPFSLESLDPSDLDTISEEIMCFRGWRGDPRWLDEQCSKWPLRILIKRE